MVRKRREGVARAEFPEPGGALESAAGAVSGSLGMNNHNKEDLKHADPSSALPILPQTSP